MKIKATGIICSVAASILVQSHQYGFATYCALMAVWVFIDEAVEKIRGEQ